MIDRDSSLRDFRADRERALTLFPVSRETEQRLDRLVDQVRRWQPVKNIVSDHALGQLWMRHVIDSAQLTSLVAPPLRWLDLGSGGGFPALVIGAIYAERDDFRIDLVESNARKCAFLRDTARVMGIQAYVHQARIEDVVDRFAGETDVVSARALAPLPQLVSWCEKLLTSGAIALFPKGKDALKELTETAKCWRLDHTIHNSLTDPAARIVRITQVSRRPAEQAAPSGG
ncbi:MAG: 16S rRNA (guanine(527)-N(7))-methyltransferase RsmG [Bosea sp. (in: a-proteobacteria)]